MLSLPSPRYMPCERCGASVDRHSQAAHECELERRLDFLVVQLGMDVDSFEDGFAAWLATPRGRFELFYAERTRPS
jgi:hypothetical protein